MAPGQQRQIVYLLKTVRFGVPAFSNVRLPDGTTIRQVDKAIHLEALARAARVLSSPMPQGYSKRGSTDDA